MQVNLIPYNQTSAGEAHGYQTPSTEALRRFAAALAPYAGPRGEGSLKVSRRRVHIRERHVLT